MVPRIKSVMLRRREGVASKVRSWCIRVPTARNMERSSPGFVSQLL